MRATKDTKVTIVGDAARDVEGLVRGAGIRAALVGESALVALTQPAAAQPDVIVIDLRKRHAVPAGVAELTRRHPSTGVVIVADQLDPTLMLQALQAGAKGFVAMPLNQQELETAIARVAPQPIQSAPGKIIGFVGAKGGVGTTTLAVNVAAALSRLATNGTLLIDLGTPYGDAAAYLNAEPRFTLADALENTHRLDEAYIRGVVVRAADGLDLLAASDRGPSGPPDPGRLRTLLEFSRRQFEYTVLDLPRTEAPTLDAVKDVTAMVLVVSQELTAVRSASRLLEWLRPRCGNDRIRLVLGRTDAKSEIQPEELEKALGLSIRPFPSDYRRALESLNRGRPLVLENHNRIASEVERFARDLAGVAETEERKKTRKWF